MRVAVSLSLVFLILTNVPLEASEADALAISANIRTRHMPFGTILDPIFITPTSQQIAGYTRCGDSALWTGAYLAAESFHYNLTRSADALANVRFALAGIKGLVDVTGDNRLARCMFPADSPYAAGIASEEAQNTVNRNPPWMWVDHTSRDQVVGVFFGLGIAFDLVDDPAVKASAADLANRLIGYISRHQWSPTDEFASTFQLRPEELQMLLQVTRHLDPANPISGPFFVPPVKTGVLLDVLSTSSYFKFNLDYMSFYHLVRLQDNEDNRNAYLVARNYTATHQYAFFNLIDRSLQGPAATRDAETRDLLEQWLERPRRDFSTDLTRKVAVCLNSACQPVPVPLRPATDFLWQRDPFQLIGAGDGFIENAGIDYLLPYWMGRYYGVIAGGSVQPAAAPGSSVAPNSLASLYGPRLASTTAQSTALPLPQTLGGVTLSVTDAAGTLRYAPLVYVSPTQINFVVPDGTVAGMATFTVANGSTPQTVSGAISTTAPTLFSMNGNGSGVAAATAISTQAANPALQAALPVFQCSATGCVPVPLRLGVDTPIYVTFYGTGIRNRTSLDAVNVTINGVSVPVLYAGPTPNYPGLDQVNVALTLNLRGAGESSVVLAVDGRKANAVMIDVQ